MKIIILSSLIFMILFSSVMVMAYENYIVSDEDFTAGYTKDLAPGDKFTVSIDGEEYFIQVLSVTTGWIEVSVSKNEMQHLSTDEDSWPDEMRFEVTEDDYYDIYVKLNSVNFESSSSKNATLTIRKIHEEVPEGTKLPYSCLEWHTCPNGTKVKVRKIIGTGCVYINPASLCPEEETPEDTCTKYYTCPDGTTVKECEPVTQYDDEGNVSGSGCLCKINPELLCESATTVSVTTTTPIATTILVTTIQTTSTVQETITSTTTIPKETEEPNIFVRIYRSISNFFRSFLGKFYRIFD